MKTRHQHMIHHLLTFHQKLSLICLMRTRPIYGDHTHLCDILLTNTRWSVVTQNCLLPHNGQQRKGEWRKWRTKYWASCLCKTNLHPRVVLHHVSAPLSSVCRQDILPENVHVSHHQTVLVGSDVSNVRTTDMFNVTAQQVRLLLFAQTTRG